jgi:hypothetical protein
MRVPTDDGSKEPKAKIRKFFDKNSPPGFGAKFGKNFLDFAPKPGPF